MGVRPVLWGKPPATGLELQGPPGAWPAGEDFGVPMLQEVDPLCGNGQEAAPEPLASRVLGAPRQRGRALGRNRRGRN